MSCEEAEKSNFPNNNQMKSKHIISIIAYYVYRLLDVVDSILHHVLYIGLMTSEITSNWSLSFVSLRFFYKYGYRNKNTRTFWAFFTRIYVNAWTAPSFHMDVECRSQNFFNNNYFFYNSHENGMNISTNKPSIGRVLIEIT